MLTHKLVTPSTTNQYNIAHWSKHVAVYLRSLLYFHVPYHQETLFLHRNGPLYQIILFRLSQHRNQDWIFLCQILSFILTFPHQGSTRNTIFANIFCLWYLSCFILCDGFVNVIGRLCFPLIFCGRRRNHAGTTNTGVTRKQDNLLKGIWDLVPNGIRNQWPIWLTVQT